MSDSLVSSAALAAALTLLGAPAVPLRAAADRLGWPCRSHAALAHRLSAGTLPVRPRKLSGRWFVLAADLAVQLAYPHTFGLPEGQNESARTASQRRPGRPRKLAGGAQ